MGWPPHFDHEKPDVYQLELKSLSWVTQFLADLWSRSLAPTRELREQLDRASLWALLNTAEGNGRRQGRQRAKFFDEARGSAIEFAACLDASVAQRICLFGSHSSRQRTVGSHRSDADQYRVHASAAGLASYGIRVRARLVREAKLFSEILGTTETQRTPRVGTDLNLV
jgi:four helix bundle protein